MSTPAEAGSASGLLHRLDHWMAVNPWHPRVAPFFLYIVFLAAISFLPENLPALYPPVYAMQCGLVVWLLWRYRTLLPEMNLRWHWLGPVSGVGLLIAWVMLGWFFAGEWSARWEALLRGELLGSLDPAAEPTRFEAMREQSIALFWVALLLRLVGMSLVVPFFEELFTRSALLRGLTHPRQTAIGFVQLASDMPLIGDWLTHTTWGHKAGTKEGMFTRQLRENTLADITLFGVLMSTLVFMLNHARRDWAGCIACGLVWCVMIAWTNRKSLPAERRLCLGPVIWSHGITNALLWAYSLGTGDWQFL